MPASASQPVFYPIACGGYPTARLSDFATYTEEQGLSDAQALY